MSPKNSKERVSRFSKSGSTVKNTHEVSISKLAIFFRKDLPVTLSTEAPYAPQLLKQVVYPVRASSFS